MITRSVSPHNTVKAERSDVPDGVHAARVSEAYLDQTPTGIEYISLRLEIVGHENARHIYTKLWLSDGQGNSNRLFDAMLSCGHLATAKGELPDPTPAHFEGRDCTVRVGLNKRGYKDVLYWRSARNPRPSSRNITHDSLAGNGTRPAFKSPAYLRVQHAQAADQLPF
jgi:hypothetical protein